MSLDPTQQRLSAQHRDRWSDYETNASILELSERLTPAELKRFEIFEPYKDELLESISPDVTVALWDGGAVLFEEGTYIDVAFFIVHGEVQVSVDAIAASPQPIFDASRTQMGLRLPDQTSYTQIAPKTQRVQHTITLLTAMDFDLVRGQIVTLGPGELFGEIGAMSGWPQSVTARTRTRCQLVQIRLPALRLMRKRSAALKKKLDQTYRERSLLAQLRTTPLLRDCSEPVLRELGAEVELISLDPGQVLVTEGETADALYLVRSGFVKLEQHYGESELVVSYLSKGMTLGELELLTDGLAKWEATARSAEYAELVKIPAASLARVLDAHPAIREQLFTTSAARVREAGFSRRHVGHSEFTQIALDTGLVQGNSILVIDTEVCTRCDDCVRACAATHGGRPRFVREGNKVRNLLVARACYHCRDPVCLVGCPTGAIHRAGVGAVVEIDEDICIGCGTCANGCPYDNIVMHETGETWPGDMVPEGLRGEPRLVASKCDLCESRGHEPACVTNCPQGCAHRVGSLEQVAALFKGEG